MRYQFNAYTNTIELWHSDELIHMFTLLEYQELFGLDAARLLIRS